VWLSLHSFKIHLELRQNSEVARNNFAFYSGVKILLLITPEYPLKTKTENNLITKKVAIQMHKKAYFYSISLIALSYLLFEYFFIPYQALAADEFVFARHILDYTKSIPYLDFEPYKSVLGHYLLALPLFFSHSLFAPIFYMKGEIALINTICIMIACYWGASLFKRSAVLITLLALLANHYFLIYSADLRVDMLSSWFCLFAALSVMQQRFTLGGVLMGIAFLISQKAMWYIVAINGAMLCSAYSLRDCLRFNVFSGVTVFIYIAIWSLVASPGIVLHNFFYDSFIQAGIDFYLQIYLACWQAVLTHGPVLFLLWPFTLFSLFFPTSELRDAKQSLFSVCFASMALVLFITYKQPFPYNFVFTVPAFFLLYASFFSWVTTTKKHIQFMLLTAFAVTGIAYPFFIALKESKTFDGTYQRTMTAVAAELIGNDSDYVSGIPFLFTKDQPIEGMKNLIGPQLEFITTSSEKMRALLLPSLYLAPTTPEKIIDDFERAPVKVIISNYRMELLPPRIQTYLNEHYQHYYGSIYLYAPVVHASQFNFFIKFSGDYRLKAKTHVKIDGKRVRANRVIHLNQGDHLTDAKSNYRLIFIPPVKPNLNPAFQKDNSVNMIKAIVA
jgi:hypothetical protein